MDRSTIQRIRQSPVYSWVGYALTILKIDQYKYVVVGLYSTNKLHGMNRWFEKTAKLSDFISMRFLLVNCDSK